MQIGLYLWREFPSQAHPRVVSALQAAAQGNCARQRHRCFQPHFLPDDVPGVYLAPSQFEAGFTSTVHNGAVIEKTIAAAQEAFLRM